MCDGVPAPLQDFDKSAQPFDQKSLMRLARGHELAPDAEVHLHGSRLEPGTARLGGLGRLHHFSETEQAVVKGARFFLLPAGMASCT